MNCKWCDKDFEPRWKGELFCPNKNKCRLAYIRKNETDLYGWSKARKERLSKKMRGPENPFFGKKHSEETKKKLSEKSKLTSCFRRLSKDPEFQRKRRKALYAKPNKLELLLDKLIQKVCPEQFRFVGDGQFIIDGLNPDWVHIKGQRKIIELFGRSFHDPEHCSWPVPQRSTEEGRRKALEDQGYEMLVIWDNELYKATHLIEEKVKSFVEGGLKCITDKV
jgi:very-short-patch-repair endonuclease